MRIGQQLHLTYCTNVHPGNDWREVQASMREYGPALKRRISPDRPFGIGLRLSHLASEELLEQNRLLDFRGQLARDGLYVFTLNGFAYGSFHRERVKDMVHAPDWRTEERANYTIRLAEILAVLLPDDVDEGSISTSPLSYKPWQEGMDVGADVWADCVEQLVWVVQALMEIERATGKYIHVDLEPEPDGLLETADEVCAFFREHLLVHGAARLAGLASLSVEHSRQALLRHIGVCLDTCHMAIEYETPTEYIQKLDAVGIRIGKVQISSALQVPFGKDPTGLASEVNAVEDSPGRALRNVCPHRREDGGRLPIRHIPQALAPYVESTYLHQVIQRNRDGRLVRYRDLPEALACVSSAVSEASEWRVHFHVPVFTASCGAFTTTQREIVETLALLAEKPFTRHLEIETYTWDVLPDVLKMDLTESIVREFAWTQRALSECMQKVGACARWAGLVQGS